MRASLALAGAIILGWPAAGLARSLPTIITPGSSSQTAGSQLIAMPRVSLRAAVPSTAASTIPVPAGTTAACHNAAVAAERSAGLPAGMLDAIGRVESGRFDPDSGEVWAWPFAVNAAGVGRSFASYAEAAAWVRERQAAGVQSIDVGCFQINLMHHPDAFASLEEAFDPVANANYAARFLNQLRDKTGGWATAVAWYHSANPGQGEPYRNMVMARWPGHDIAASDAIWRGNPTPAPAVRMVRMASLPNFGIKVWSPGAGNGVTPVSAGTYAGGVIISMRGFSHAVIGRLPGIVTAER